MADPRVLADPPRRPAQALAYVQSENEAGCCISRSVRPSSTRSPSPRRSSSEIRLWIVSHRARSSTVDQRPPSASSLPGVVWIASSDVVLVAARAVAGRAALGEVAGREVRGRGEAGRVEDRALDVRLERLARDPAHDDAQQLVGEVAVAPAGLRPGEDLDPVEPGDELVGRVEADLPEVVAERHVVLEARRVGQQSPERELLDRPVRVGDRPRLRDVDYERVVEAQPALVTQLEDGRRVNDFVIDAMRKSVPVVTRRRDARSANPRVLVQASAPSRTTPAASPGNRCSTTNFAASASSRGASGSITDPRPNDARMRPPSVRQTRTGHLGPYRSADRSVAEGVATSCSSRPATGSPRSS
jgi:hypothetical protein